MVVLCVCARACVCVHVRVCVRVSVCLSVPALGASVSVYTANQ